MTEQTFQHTSPPILDRRFSVAPMMDLTDSHYRNFARHLTKHTLLYTEMITTGAILHGDKHRFLSFANEEHPIAVQLGGSNPKALRECAIICEDFGYDEINLNVGCPSDRVQNNMIGACLMDHPGLVSECLAEMQSAVSVPVTVKHRIGIDDRDSYELLHQFVEHVAKSGCSTFIVHARKAILKGLSPKENREIPPLDYATVYQLKKDFPQLEIIINGGIKTIQESKNHLNHVDGVMIGREAYYNPSMLLTIDEEIFLEAPASQTATQALTAFFPYISSQLDKGAKLGHISRHILGLFHGKPGGRKFRQYLSENAHLPTASIKTLELAIEHLNI